VHWRHRCPVSHAGLLVGVIAGGVIAAEDIATIDFGDIGQPQASQPSQPDASGFTGLTPWQPGSSDGTADAPVGPIDTPPFQYPDRLQTDQALSGDPRVQAFLTTLRGQEGQRYNAVVGHIDETADFDQEKMIVAHARDECLAGLEKLCARIAKKAANP